MKAMKDRRRELHITQDVLADATGIPQQNISALEHGRFKPNQSTRSRIEKVLGKVDWIENEKIVLRKDSYFKAERLLKKIIELSLTMDAKQKDEFKQLVYKYFK
jgi:predicted transcriptional regulator